MGEIIELADERRAGPSGDAAASDGARRILEQYVGREEQARYLLTNGQRGLVVEDDDGREELSPAPEGEGVMVLTDERSILAVGRSDDRVVQIPHVEVVAVRREESFFTERLVIATTATRWEFPFKGDLEPAESFLKEALSAWSGARTAIESFRERMATAIDHLDDGEFDAALDRADAAEAALLQAESRLESLGPGAVESLPEPAVREDIERLRARVYRERGERAFDRATVALEGASYHDAYEAMTAATAALQRAIDHQPASFEDGLEARLETVETALDELLSRPIEEARSAHDEARDCEGMARAIALEDALDRYRDALSVCWGERGEQFEGDPSTIRARIIDIVDDIYDTWTALARERLDEGDAYAEQGANDRARTHYEDARTHLERARSVTAELHPDRDSDLDPWFDAVENRLESIDNRATVVEPGLQPDSGAEVDPVAPGTTGRPLEALGTAELIDIVTDIFASDGWSTSVLDIDDPYHIVASRRDPIELTAFVRVVAGETPTQQDVARIADAADDASEADVAVLVAPEISTSVRERASEAGVKLLDADRIVTALETVESVGSGATA